LGKENPIPKVSRKHTMSKNKIVGNWTLHQNCFSPRSKTERMLGKGKKSIMENFEEFTVKKYTLCRNELLNSRDTPKILGLTDYIRIK